MKRTRLLLVVLFVMILSSFTACGGHLHAMGDWEIGTNPTWEEEGLYVQKCAGCDAFVSKVIPALSDTTVWTLTETVDPDHVNTGKEVYTSVYGEVVVTLDVIPHSFGDYTLTVNPSLDATGKATHACECGHSEEVEVPALSDSVWTVETVDPTHLDEGSNTYTSIYGAVVTSIAVIPHTYGAYTLTVNPSLDATGKATHACDCGHSEEVEVPALSDSVWTVETVDPTHFVEGSNTYTSVYGTVVTSIAVAPHVYGAYSWVVAPSMDAAGTAIHSCECGHSEEVPVAALSDASVWSVEHTVLANYNEGGLDTYTCEYGAVEVALVKLVAPYDNKTYAPINFDADDDGWKNGVVKPGNSWVNTSITLGANSIGEGTAYPFRGGFKYIMVNSATGEFIIEQYTLISVTQEDEDGNATSVYVPDWNETKESKKISTAWVDFETGLIVTPRNASWIDVNLYTPFEVGFETATAVASSWYNSIAIDYTFDGITHSIFVYDGRAYFGVSFVDLAGNVIAANECYSANNLHVLDKDGNLIAGFAMGKDGLVESDGIEGTYTNGSDSLFLNGAGVATLNGANGTYVVDGSVVGVFANGEYYEVTLNGNGYTSVKPMVKLSFDGGEFGADSELECNKNIEITLPVLSATETHVFKGWALNGEALSANYVPTENVTLTAIWKEKIEIKLIGILAGDNDTLLIGEGDVIGNYLPVYGIEISSNKIFRGWYLDAEFSIPLPEEAEVTPEDTGITIYAKWDDIPAYYGTYYGTEIWNEKYGNSRGYTLTIDEFGNMTGVITGAIVSYDESTQTISWAKTNSSAVYTFYFNKELGVIAGIYNNYNIGNDYYILSKANSTSGKVNAAYGVKAPKQPGSSDRNYYAQFVNMSTDLGDVEIFLYNNHIYHDFTATDAAGTPLTTATVKDSKTLIVKDASGNIIVSVASAGSSFSANNTTVDLDAYFGTYTNGAETVVLDGSGSITYGDKTGSYAKVEGKDYGFDVYLNNNSEYYRLTLEGNSFAIVKPMVTVSFDAGSYATVEAVEVNMNVAFTLPVVSHDERVFRGWYEDAEYNTAAASEYVPTQNVTLYAKWDEKLTLTIVYGNGLEDLVLYYGFGDVTVPVEPEYTNNKAFEGWYLDAEFTVPYVAGKISENTVIYCKWQAPHYLYGSYVGGNVYGSDSNGGTIKGSTSTTALVIDENGIITSGRKQGGLISECDENGIFNVDGAYGAADVENGIIMINYGTYSTYNYDLMIYVKGATKAATGSSYASYWDAGKVKLMTFTLEGHALSVMHALVYNGRIYGNVTFTSSDSSVTAANAYKAPDIAIYDCHGELIVKFAHDGTCLRPLDGFEGAYTTTEGTIVVNGVNTINIGGVNGTYTKAAEGSSYTHDAYVDGCYYEVTLNVDGYTAVVNKPMVTITYETFGKADLANSVVNKNIALDLAIPENDAFVFRAWYFDVELTQAVPANFVPTEDVTVYAKWAEKVVLTVVYGNGLENTTANYAVGDTITLVAPGATNGLFFGGWYADADFTVPFTATTISASTTVYCSWTSAVPFTMEQFNATYAMVYDAATGTWKSSNQGKGSSYCGLTIEATTSDIEITFDWVVSSEGNWDALYVYANGQQLVNKSAGSGEKSGTISITLRAGNTLQLYYSKDGSGNKGSDTATISNLTVAGSPVTDANLG